MAVQRYMQRVVVPQVVLNDVMDAVNSKLAIRLAAKGSYSYMSYHEGLGIITEEFKELIDAVQSNDNAATNEELIDVAVGCIFALASMTTLQSTCVCKHHISEHNNADSCSHERCTCKRFKE